MKSNIGTYVKAMWKAYDHYHNHIDKLAWVLDTAAEKGNVEAAFNEWKDKKKDLRTEFAEAFFLFTEATGVNNSRSTVLSCVSPEDSFIKTAIEEAEQKYLKRSAL
jgi:hypothetical protein